jgi:hypothetical protein
MRFSTIQTQILAYILSNDRNALEQYRPGTRDRDELDELKANAEGQNAREINNLLNMIDRYLSNDEFVNNSPSNVDITRYTKAKVLDLLKRLKPLLQTASDRLDLSDQTKNYSSIESYEKLITSFTTPIKSLRTCKRYVENTQWSDEHNTYSKTRVLSDINSDLETLEQLKARIRKNIRRLKRGHTSSSARKSSSSSSSRKSSSSSSLPRSIPSPKSPDGPPPPRVYSPASPNEPPPSRARGRKNRRSRKSKKRIVRKTRRNRKH